MIFLLRSIFRIVLMLTVGCGMPAIPSSEASLVFPGHNMNNSQQKNQNMSKHCTCTILKYLGQFRVHVKFQQCS